MTAPRSSEAETPVARLAARAGRDGAPFLAPEEAIAADRLRADFTRGGLAPGVTQRWEPVRGEGGGAARGGGDLTDAAIDARARFHRALDAVGPELSGILVDVCCFLKGTETVERERRWPARSAKLLLKAGLAALARHYGLVGGAQSGGGGGRLRSWAAPGARPVRRDGR